MSARDGSGGLINQRGRKVERLRLWLLCTGLLAVPWLWLGPSTRIGLGLAVLVGGFAFGAYALMRRGWGRKEGAWNPVATGIDILIACLWLEATGGPHSPFFPLLLIVSIAAGARYRPRATLAVGATVAASYVGTLGVFGELLPNLGRVAMQLVILLSGAYLSVQISRDALENAVARERAAQRKEADARHAHLLALLHATREAMIGTDAAGHINSWNVGAARLTGYEESEALGRSLSMFFPDIGAGSPARWLREEIGKPKRAVGVQRLRTRRGDWRSVSVVLSSLQSEDGAPKAVLLTARDETERLQAEASLKESRRMLEDAQRHAKVGSYIWHPPEDRAVWSDELYRILGVPKEDGPLGLERFNRHVHPDDLPFAIARGLVAGAPALTNAAADAAVARSSRGVPKVRVLSSVRAAAERVHRAHERLCGRSTDRGASSSRTGDDAAAWQLFCGCERELRVCNARARRIETSGRSSTPMPLLASAREWPRRVR